MWNFTLLEEVQEDKTMAIAASISKLEAKAIGCDQLQSLTDQRSITNMFSFRKTTELKD